MKAELSGIIEGLKSEDYHKGPGISFTSYKEFLRSPAHFRHYLANPPESTSSQLLGQLVHAMVLETEVWKERFFLVGGPMNKNPFKAEADEAREKGLIPIGKTDGDKAKGMAEAILKHKDAAFLIRTGKREISGFHMDPVLNILMKCRPDVWHENTEVIADVKYVSDASEYGFERMCMRMRYHLQSAWYLSTWGALVGKKLRRHIHICVEEEGPHAVQLHALSDHDLEQSQQSIRKNLTRYAECVAKDQWPSYEDGIRTLILPHYAYQMTAEGEVL